MITLSRFLKLDILWRALDIEAFQAGIAVTYEIINSIHHYYSHHHHLLLLLIIIITFWIYFFSEIVIFLKIVYYSYLSTVNDFEF